MNSEQVIVLRGGAVTRDRRLDRIAEHDPRNAQFPARGLFGAAAPPRLRSYTWTVPAHFDQGRQGACVAYATGHAAVARPRSYPVAGVAPLLADNTLYFSAQRDDEFPGGSYPGAVPQAEGTSVLGGMKAAVGLGLFTSYHWADTERDVAQLLGYRGPVVIGVDWYEGMEDPDEDGFLHPTGVVLGGHSTLLYSLNVPGDYYRIWQSWGPSWGVKGTAKIRRGDLGALITAPGGEACFPVTA
jgi:hypothetical protein